jgi:hypothetical protein
MLRGALGVLGGGVVWWIVFWGAAIVLALAWPAYGAFGREFFATGAFRFTAPMAICNVVLWALAEIAAGWIAVVIARRRESAWILGALIMAFLCLEHLYFAWANFPWWYNVLVALPSGPAILLGGRLAARFVRAGPPIAAAT